MTSSTGAASAPTLLNCQDRDMPWFPTAGHGHATDRLPRRPAIMWFRGDENAVTTRPCVGYDLRDRDSDRRERRSIGREADADQRQKSLDDREHEVTRQEDSADRDDTDNSAGRSTGRRGQVDAQAFMTRLGQFALSLQGLEKVQATWQRSWSALSRQCRALNTQASASPPVAGVAPIVLTDEVVSQVD
jgi:hypothetical protein